MAKRNEGEQGFSWQKVLSGTVAVLVSLLIALVVYWGRRVDTGVDSLENRVGNVEKQVAEISSEVKNLKEDNSRMDTKLDDLQKLLLERLPPKN